MCDIELKIIEQSEELPADAVEVFSVTGYKVPSMQKACLAFNIKPSELKGDDEATVQGAMLYEIVSFTLEQVLNKNLSEVIENHVKNKRKKDQTDEKSPLFAKVECRLDREIGAIFVGFKVEKDFIDNLDEEVLKDAMKKIVIKLRMGLEAAGL